MKLWLSTNKGVFELTGPAFAQQAVHFPAVKSTMMLPHADGRRVWAALDTGHFGQKLHRSNDGGKTWAELAVPKYPPQPEGEPPEVNPMSGRPNPWTLKMIWSLEAGGREGELWCGTLPGGVFKSTDDGDTWQLCESLWNDPRRKAWFGGGYDEAGVHSINVDPNDADHVLIGISCAGAWETFDGGKTWTLEGRGMIADYMPPDQADDPGSQDPHRLICAPTNFNRVWVQHHCGMFMSDDCGHQFRPIGPKMGADPSGFGFAVAVHPSDADTAWFVPALSDEKRVPVNGRVEVLKTTDGGKTFVQKQTGLPQQDAWDLAYRHCLEVADDGKTLAWGSTTGNLYLSKDGGESWKLVNAHLPAIYAVRFST